MYDKHELIAETNDRFNLDIIDTKKFTLLKRCYDNARKN